MKKGKRKTSILKIVAASFFGIMMLGSCIAPISGLISFNTKTKNNVNKIDFDTLLKNIARDFDNNFNESVLVSNASDEAKLKSQKISVIIEIDDKALVDSYQGSKFDSLPNFVDSKEGITKQNEMVKEQAALAKTLLQEKLVETVDGNYTVLLNGLYATTTYGKIDQIRQLDGVKNAYVSTIYQVADTKVTTTDTSTRNSSTDSNVTFNYTDIDPTTGIYNNDTDYDGSGTIVAVLDSGFDYTHEVFQMEVAEPAMTKKDIDKVLKDTFAYSFENGNLTADDVYISSKIPFAYDYANRKIDVVPIESDHGTHVSGIIGGESDQIKGIAPQTQFAWMKVFNDDDGGGDSADIINALEDAALLGVDAINMSLGAIGGYSLEVIPANETNSLQERTNKIYSKLESQGISVLCAAGNEYSSGYSSTLGTNSTKNPESGTISSPGSYSASLTVASINGELDPYALVNGDSSKSIFFTDATDSKQSEYKFIDHMFETIDKQVEAGKLSYNADGTVDVPYTVISGFGLNANYVGSNKDVTGKIAIVKRGGNVSFEDKLLAAYSHGAIGILIYNNVSGVIRMTCGDELFIPVASISVDAGNSIVNSGKTGTLRFNKSYNAGPFMSDFSSWGPLADLTLKPEITAHGGNIYSSVLGNKYDKMSGTSMATPNTCGIVIVIREYVKKNWPTLSPSEVTSMVNQLLMSTAVICKNEVGNPYSPRKQGAGLATLMNAIETNAYLYVDGLTKTKLELGDDKEKTGKYVAAFNISNISNQEMIYDVSNFTMTETVSSDEKSVAETAHMFNPTMQIKVGNNLSLNGTKVTVPANTTSTIEVTLQLSDEEKAYIDKNFVNGMYVEGYITLENLTTVSDKKNIELSIPFLAFYGDWLKAPMFDKTYYDVEKDRADDSISDKDKTVADLYATTPYGKYGEYYILPLGGYVYEMDAGYEKIAGTEDKAAISIDSDSAIYQLYSVYAGMLRGAKELKTTITNVATGEVIYSLTTYNNKKSTYYGSSGGILPYNEQYNLSMLDKDGYAFANNTQFEIKMVASLDYKDGDKVSNNEIKFRFYVDYEAPTVEKVDYVREWNKTDKDYRYYINLTVSDNRYVQSVRPCAIKDKKLIPLTDNPIPVYQTSANTSTLVKFELTDYFDDLKNSDYPDTVFFMVDDYAMNSNIYYVSLNGSDNAKLAFNSKQIEVNKNSRIDLNDYVNVENAMLNNFNWTSSNNDIAVVGNGKVYGVSKGIATITGKSAMYGTSVQVKVKVIDNNTTNKISLEKVFYSGYTTVKSFNDDYEHSSLASQDTFDYMPKSNSFEIYPSEQFRLSVELEPWYVDKSKLEIKYVSSNSEFVSVDETGLVTALKETKTPINIKAVVYENGMETVFTPSTSVTVKNPFITSGVMLMYYKGFGGDIVVPDDLGIKYIGPYAFAHYTYDGLDKDGYAIQKVVGDDTITSITLPAGVKYIQKYAFSGLTALKSVTLPEDTTDIYVGAFEGCINLETINLNNVVKVENYAFRNCEKLSNVNKEGQTTGKDLSNIVTIGEGAFANTALTKIDLEKVRVVFKNAFANTKLLNDVTIHEETPLNVSMFENSAIENIVINKEVIYDKTFINSSLKEVTFTKENITIGKNAFAGCKQLQTLNFPNAKNVTISAQAFANTGITTLVLPNGDVYINDEAFKGSSIEKLVLSANTKLHMQGTPFIDCEYFNSLEINGTNTLYTVEDNVLYSNTKDTIVLVPTNVKVNSFASTITKIGHGAFAGNNVIESLTLPSTITDVEDFAFAYSNIKTIDFVNCANTNFGTYVFYYAKDLNVISNVNVLNTINDYMFTNTSINDVKLGTNVTVSYGAFANISTLNNLTIGDSATIGAYAFYKSFTSFGTATLGSGTIGEYAFAETKLNSINTTNIIEVGKGAFMSSAITSISFEKVENIGESAFAKCSQLKEVTLSNTMSDTLSRGMFKECNELTTVNNMESISTIESYAFFNCYKLSTIDLSNVHHIGKYAFAYVTELEDAPTSSLVTIDLSSIATIDDYAFLGNTGLNNVLNLEKSTLETINEGAFSQCSKLTNINLINVKVIKDLAFYLDSSLKTVDLTNVTYVGNKAFANCGINKLDLQNCLEVGEFAFYANPIRDLSIPSLKVVRTYAFNSTYVANINLPESLETIEFGAFSSSNYLTQFSHEGYLDYNNSKYLIEDGVLYIYLPNGSLQLQAYPLANARKTYTVKEGTTRIDAYAFYSSTSALALTEITLPRSLTNIGEFAFYGADKLKKVNFLAFDAPTLEGSYNASLINYLNQLTQNSLTNDLNKLYHIAEGNVYNMYYYLYPYYYANFVDYVGFTSKLTMVYPQNGQGYDTWVYTNYFSEKIIGDAVADDATNKAIEAIDALTDITKADNSNKQQIIDAYDSYSTITDEGQIALFDSEKVAHLLDLYNQVLEIDTPTLTEDEVKPIVGTYKVTTTDGEYTLTINKDGSGEFIFSDKGGTFDRVRHNGDNYSVNFNNTNFIFSVNEDGNIQFKYYISNLTLEKQKDNNTTDDNKPTKKGCKGAIATSGSIVCLLSAAYIVIRKRKENI